jgi:hypothetical protein
MFSPCRRPEKSCPVGAQKNLCLAVTLVDRRPGSFKMQAPVLPHVEPARGGLLPIERGSVSLS